ncbi:hypothetical protein GCM10022409_27980 [Hymenobacter glaciei]|uniref:histidine kinase n=1 Tax=Hymenobacter glaciei TaxID=877209 RepID=A0ABP7UCW8_9BACT
MRLLSNYPGVPDTLRVFYLSRLAAATYDSSLSKALHYAQQAGNLAKKIGYVRGELNCIRLTANIYSGMGDYVAAIRCYQAGVDLAQAKNLKPHLFRLYDNMGATAAAAGEYARSLKYMLRALAALKELEPVINKTNAEDYLHSFSNLGNSYFALGKNEQASIYARQALALANTYQIKSGGKFRMLLGRIFEAQRPRTAATMDSAAHYLQAAVAEAEAEGELAEMADELLGLAEFYQAQRLYPAMLAATARSLKLARKLGAKHLQLEALSAMADASAALGDYRGAYTAGEQANALQKELINSEKTNAIAKLQVQYDVREQEQQIQLLTQRGVASAALAREQERRQWGLLGIAGVLALGLATGGLLHWRLRRSQGQLALANQHLGTANRTIQQAVEEKGVLLQELHHRVKNNLQMISSLLGWQSDIMPDPQLAVVLAGNQARIQSMALVHECLYQADNLAQVRIDAYLTELLTSLHSSLASPQKEITLSTDLEPVLMDTREAAYFGLLVNELVTNAYKHAFGEQSTGKLHVSLARKDAGFRLSVSDDGTGLPTTGFSSKSKSIGISLVQFMVKQLKATITVVPQLVGTHLEIIRA